MTVPTINPDQLFRRQLGFFNPTEHPRANVTFVGTGGIGSFAAFATAKLGVPSLTLIDPDAVEIHNAPNQCLPLELVGEAKVEAVKSQIAWHMGESVDVTTVVGKHDAVEDYSGVVVSGLDSMAARKELWEQKIKDNINVKLYIDARIAGQLILIYAVKSVYTPDEVASYEATLHSDEDAEPAPCTERGLIDVGFQCGALISRAIRRHYCGEDIDNITYVSQKSLTIQKGPWIK